jgi:hypothetical protein
MARTKSQIIAAVLREFGFQSAQNSDLDTAASQAFLEIVREYADVPFVWSYIVGVEVALTANTATANVPKYLGLIDEKTVKIKQSSNTPYFIAWKNPVDFHHGIQDITQSGTPRCVTMEEYTEQRKIRVWPVPSVSGYTIILNGHRNLEFKSDGTDLGDSDTLLAPAQFEELVIASMKTRMAPIVYTPDDQRTLGLLVREERKIASLKKHLPTIDPQVFVRPSSKTLRFRQGV